MTLEEQDIIRLARQTGKTKFYTKEIMKEIQKYLDDNNTTFEEYLGNIETTLRTGTAGHPEWSVMPYNTFIHTET